MKSPDDVAARLARLRREIVDAFMAGDVETWAAATKEARALIGKPNRRSEAARKVRARLKLKREKKTS